MSKPPPNSFKAACDGPDFDLWRLAIAAEVNSLASKETIKALLKSELPFGSNVLALKRLSKTKRTETGEVARCKAC
jgi:hypothetical protein